MTFDVVLKLARLLRAWSHRDWEGTRPAPAATVVHSPHTLTHAVATRKTANLRRGSKRQHIVYCYYIVAACYNSVVSNTLIHTVNMYFWTLVITYSFPAQSQDVKGPAPSTTISHSHICSWNSILYRILKNAIIHTICIFVKLMFNYVFLHLGYSVSAH